jgi:asparagine synthase (glutamine-hydrolysing)
MCGIAGIRRFDGAGIDPAALRAMAATLTHRGPDAEGFWTSEGVGFAHRRLSIIDVEGSPQPMTAHGLTVCFNGEIFNYRALREELGGAGYRFETQGDTEVLLAVHLDAGPRGIEKLHGQFAYAMWDERSRELWLSRDRLGIVPVYYYWDGRVFAFGSEIKAVLAALPDGPQVDEDSLRDYLAHRAVPWPHTLFRGVRKLPPGHRIHLDAEGNLSCEAWWSLPTSLPTPTEPGDAVDQVSDALEQAVQSQLVADVPVGAYLSGGVDSSLIAALMKRARHGGDVMTFSAGFGDPRFDELPYARKVSDLLGTKHHEILVDPADFEALWGRLTWHRDAPISEPADVAIHRIALLARDSVKVLLSGEGSDELFAGYPKYRAARAAAAAMALPKSARKRLLRGIERLLPANQGRLRIALRAMSAADEAQVFQTWFAPFTRYERETLFPGEERETHREIWNRARGDRIQRMLYVDCHTWLVDNLLERGDRMAMAASVESRPPFLDHRLVELAFGLPSDVKLRGGETKWVVKEVARRWLPSEIVDRPKLGFRVPLDAWFRGRLKGMARDMLLSSDSFTGSHMSRPAVRSLLDAHEAGRRDESIRIWTLLGLEVWHQTFFGDPSWRSGPPA